jgi:hypothetical protein
VGTNYPDTSAYTVGDQGDNPAVAANAVTVNAQPLVNQGKAVGWGDPAIQARAKIDKAAGVKFSNPVTTTTTSDDSFIAVGQSCAVMALFEAIVKKAGKNMTDASFAQAGDTLGSVDIPGLGPATYSKANPAGSFPWYLYRWDQRVRQWIANSEAYGTSS